MARRGKTKVGGGPRQDTMMRAQETGRQSIERAEGQQLGQIQRGGEQGTQAVQRGAQQGQQQLNRNEEFGARKEAQAGQQKLGEQRQELEEAKAGYERVPEVSQRSPEETARLQTQGDKPLEVDGQTGAIPGQEPKTRLQQKPAGQGPGSRAYASETARMNAVTARQNAEKSYASGRATGNSEQMEAASKSMIKGIESARNEVTATVNGQNDPVTILQSYPQNPNAEAALQSPDPAVQQQVAVRMKRNEVASANIAYMAATGSAALDYDPTNEIWQRYSKNYENIASSLRGGEPLDTPLPGQEQGSALRAWQGIRTEPEKKSFLNQSAAQLTMALSQAEFAAEAIARERGQQDALRQSQEETDFWRSQAEAYQEQFRQQGSPEFGQPVEKETKELPGGQQVESGMAARGKQFQQPGTEPGPKGEQFNPYGGFGRGAGR